MGGKGITGRRHRICKGTEVGKQAVCPHLTPDLLFSQPLSSQSSQRSCNTSSARLGTPRPGEAREVPRGTSTGRTSAPVPGQMARVAGVLQLAHPGSRTELTKEEDPVLITDQVL